MRRPGNVGRPLRSSFVLWLTLVFTVFSLATTAVRAEGSDPSSAGGDAAGTGMAEQPARGVVLAGLRQAADDGCPGGLYEVVGSELCSHGPDAAPPGVDVRRDAPAHPPGHILPAAAGDCVGDGRSGFRTQVVYARASDRLDRYGEYLASVRLWAAGADAIYRDSALETGGVRRVRFVQDAACEIDVANVVLSPEGDDDFGKTIAELVTAGFDRTDRVYLLFVDANTYCGIATVKDDDRPDATNGNNRGPSYARSDAGCWESDVVAHEHMHNMGGVQLSAPHTSGGYHCVDEWEVMCYSDEPDFPAMQVLCPDEAGNATLFDCNNDDYFSTAPPAGSYLATHWNTASSHFLMTGQPDPSIAGTVRTTRGDPVAGATVRMVGSALPATTSGPDGSYAFTNVPAGQTVVRAQPVCRDPATRTVAVDGAESVDLTVPAVYRSDAFRYTCQATTYSWVDAPTVTSLTGDDASLQVSLPFPFPFYGQNRTTVRLSTNGFLTFAPSGATAYDNAAVPSTTAPNAAVFALWDDLIVDGQASVRTRAIGSAPDRRFVVEWRNVQFRDRPLERLRFEAILHEDGRILLQYRSIGTGSLEQGASATIGVENADGNVGVQFSRNEQRLRDGLAIVLFRNQPPVARAGPDQSVATGATFTVDAGGSTDAEGGPLVFLWAQTAGPTASIRDRNAARTAIDGPNGSGDMSFRVTVTDDRGVTDTDTVVVRAAAPK